MSSIKVLYEDNHIVRIYNRIQEILPVPRK